MRHTPLIAVRRLAVVLALVAAACSGSVTTTTAATESAPSPTVATSGPQLRFGSGEMPETFPADFPIPDSAKIGSTLIDGANNRSEMIIRVGAAQDAVVVFYTQNFEQLGYTFSSELSTNGDAVVTFSKGDVSGTILVRVAANDLSEAVVQIGF